MQRFVQTGFVTIAIANLLIGPGIAFKFDFEYPESEKFYHAHVKERIESEYNAARQALVAKADELGMAVRDVDIKKLKTWMREKSFLFGTCFDSSIQKTRDNQNVKLHDHFSKCVQGGLKIADQVQRRAWSEWFSRRPGLSFQQDDTFVLLCRVQSSYAVPVFEFLKDASDEPLARVLDYYRLKDCILEKLDPFGFSR